MNPDIKTRVEQLTLAKRLRMSLRSQVARQRPVTRKRRIPEDELRRRRALEVARRVLARQRAVNPRFVPGSRPADSRARVKKLRVQAPPPSAAPAPQKGLVSTREPAPPAAVTASEGAATPPDVSGGDFARWLWYGVGAISAWWLIKSKKE